VIVQESEVTDLAGTPLWTTTSGIFARGEGGFGGSRGPALRLPPPSGPPDVVVELPTLPQQALLYRLCGDRNPLHADPAFAATAGFDRPILHGLCTYGMVCKAMVDELLEGDAAAVGSFSARFAGVVFPGETLRIRMWKTETGFQSITTSLNRQEAAVLDETVLTAR
jgi:acyl dehydratase